MNVQIKDIQNFTGPLVGGDRLTGVDIDGNNRNASLDQIKDYSDSVKIYANLAAFPLTGSTGLIYKALDTGLSYDWNGTAYVRPSGGGSDSQTLSLSGSTLAISGGNSVTLAKASVGLGNVDNTSDANKPISTAQQAALNLIPKVYNIKKYGAVGDGKTVKDGVTTSGSPTLTSANAVFTNGDVGKKILINEQLLTISSWQSATQVTLSGNVTASGTGVVFRYGTDNTVAIQNTINAAYNAKGGVIFTPLDPLPYFVAGPLIHTDNSGFDPNCQIFIPSVVAPYQGGNQQPISFVFEAEVPPTLVESGFIDVNAGDYNQGTMIQSILPYSAITGDYPAVFGIMGYTDQYGHFTFSHVTVKNTWVRTHMHPTHGAYLTGFRCVSSTNTVFADSRVDIDVSGFNSVMPDVPSFGIMGVQSNGGTKNEYRGCLVVGYSVGYSWGEHSVVDNCQVMMCDYAADFQKAGHASTVNHFTVHWCRHGFGFNLYPNGYPIDQHIVNMYGVIIERTALGKWYDAIYDLNDPGNNIKGNLIAASSTSGQGLTTTIVKNGGANLNYIYMANPINGGGGSASGPLAVTFNAAIPFDRDSKLMTNNVGGAIAFTVNSTGAIIGGKTLVRLVADGSNAPTFDAAFVKRSDSGNYVNTANKVNEIEFFNNAAGEKEYKIWQGATVTPPSGTPVNANYTSLENITESPAHQWNETYNGGSVSQHNKGVDVDHPINVIYYAQLAGNTNAAFISLDTDPTATYCQTNGGNGVSNFTVLADNGVLIYMEQGGPQVTLTIPAITYNTATLYGIRVSNAPSTPGVDAVYSVDGGTTWVSVHPFSTNYSGTLYAKVGLTVFGYACLNPKLLIS